MNEPNDHGVFECIAERVLYVRAADGGLGTKVTIRIGKPYAIDDGQNAACPVEIDGLIGRTRDIVGIDPIHALHSAIKFTDKFISEISPTKVLLWPDGEPYKAT
jgi:hypothetical protein